MIKDDKSEKLIHFSESGGADTQSLFLKRKILNSTPVSTDRSFAKIYYVSSVDGDDSNDGLSEKSSFKTVSKVNSVTDAGNSKTEMNAVLFKCGDTFRTNVSLELKANTVYSTYGVGEKPVISGSFMNYARENIWEPYSKHIWHVFVDGFHEKDPRKDVGNIVFNDGAFSGVKKDSINDLKLNGDFYYDCDLKVLYLYFDKDNPGLYFNSIELQTTYQLAELDKYDTGNIIIDNISFRYASRHGIVLICCTDIQILNCEIGWVGGIYIIRDGKKIPYHFGNAIELWNKAVNVKIENCYIYQAYDTAFTFQGTETNLYTDILFAHNLVEYCGFNLEFWASHQDDNAKIKNIAFSDNILRFSGCGYSGQQRLDAANQAFLLSQAYRPSKYVTIKDFIIKNNIFDCANSRYAFGTYEMFKHIIFKDNVYYQKNGSNFSVRNINDASPPKTKDEFAEGIRSFDTDVPDDNIVWLEDKSFNVFNFRKQ